jgi:hypothetical protein
LKKNGKNNLKTSLKITNLLATIFFNTQPIVAISWTLYLNNQLPAGSSSGR